MVKKIQNVKKNQLNPHPIIQKLEAASQDGSVVLLDGFIGGTDKSNIRLYKGLDLCEYLEIPKDGIVETMPIQDDKEGRSRLFVKSSSRITAVSIIRSSTTAENLEEPPKVAYKWSREKILPGYKEFDRIRQDIDKTIKCRKAQNIFDNMIGLLPEASNLPMGKFSSYLKGLSSAWDDVVNYCSP